MRRLPVPGSTVLIPALAALLHHLIELLPLGVGQNGFQFLMRVLHQRPHLLMPLVRSQRSVLMHRPHLLVLILQNRTYLLLLLGRQVQRFRQMPKLPIRAVAVVRAHLTLGIGLRSIRPRIVILGQHS